MRNHILILTLVATFLASALAGCVGDAEGDGKQDTTELPPQEGLGTLVVTVMTDLFDTIPGANVVIRELKLNKTTDAEGKATFTNLEPNRYTVFASKLGFRAGAKTLEVIADTEARLPFQLEAVPLPRGPYRMGYQWDGFISCAVGAWPAGAADLCDNVTVGALVYQKLDEESKSRFLFHIDEGATAGAVLLEEDGSGTNMGETYRLIWIAPPGPEPKQIQGRSPLMQHYDFNESVGFTRIEGGVPGQIEVRPAAGTLADWDDASLLIWQKRFSLYLAMFHNGKPIPDDYNLKADFEAGWPD